MLAVYDPETNVEVPTLFTDRTLRIPGSHILNLLNDAGYGLPEDAFAHDVVVELPMQKEEYR